MTIFYEGHYRSLLIFFYAYRIAEKDQQINQSEESLANERLKLTSKEEDLMVKWNIICEKVEWVIFQLWK